MSSISLKFDFAAAKTVSPNMRHLLLAAIAPILGLVACDDGKPIVLKTAEIASPDGKWMAVLEEVDNGLGFGQGALYQEVHILPPHEKARSHGNPSSSNVFYAESAYGEGPGVTVRWLDSKHLQISYNPNQRPGKLVKSFFGIDIEARPVATGAK